MKKIVWFIPTMFLLLSTILHTILSVYKVNIEILDFMIFFVCTYGMVMIAPCFYSILIYKFSSDKRGLLKLFLHAVGVIVVNAVIMCPYSILYYLNLKERGAHDLDLFPMYIIVPLVIILVGTSINILLKRKRH